MSTAELAQLVSARRKELGLSYQSLAAVSVDPKTATKASSGWLHRLETGLPVIAPSADVLAALATGLDLPMSILQEAAAAQFFGLRLPREQTAEVARFVELLGSVPEKQRKALLDLVAVMAAGAPRAAE